MGKHKKAIGVYERGLKSAPDHPLLHFNIGVTYSRMGKSDEAKEHFKRTLVGNPAYISAHLALGHEFLAADQNIPGLLALLRFLTLEPDPARSEGVLSLLRNVLESQAEEKAEGDVLVTINSDSDTLEGDFSSAELMLAVSRAGQFTEERRDRTDLENMVDQLGSLFAFMDETDEPKDTGFAMEYYVPYFVELRKNNFQEALVHYIHQSSEAPAVSEWLDANYQQVKRFEDWSQTHQNWLIEMPDK